LLEAQEIAGHGSPDGRDMHLEARTSGRGLLVAVRIVVIVEKIPTEYPTSEFPSRILVGARMIDRTAFPAGTIEDGCSDAIAGFEAVERDAQGREGLGQGADPAIGHAPRGIEQVSKGCRGVSPRLLRLGLDAPRGVSPAEDLFGREIDRLRGERMEDDERRPGPLPIPGLNVARNRGQDALVLEHMDRLRLE